MTSLDNRQSREEHITQGIGCVQWLCSEWQALALFNFSRSFSVCEFKFHVLEMLITDFENTRCLLWSSRAQGIVSLSGGWEGGGRTEIVASCVSLSMWIKIEGCGIHLPGIITKLKIYKVVRCTGWKTPIC